MNHFLVVIGGMLPLVEAHWAALGLLSLLSALAAATVVLEKERTGGAERLAEDPKTAVAEARLLRALIVGAGTVGQALAKSLEDDGRYHVIGFVDDGELSAETELPVLGSRDRTADLVVRYDIDEVFVAYAPTWQQQLAEELAAREPGVRVSVVPSHYEALMPMAKVESIGDVALVRLTHHSDRARDCIKRGFDLLTATVGLILLSPLCAVVALLIKVTSPGPAIFAQERVGRHGKRFTVFKFRTMVNDAEAGTGPVLADGNGDSRLTALGRWLRDFRMDEIPQLWNVVRGEMSLVGPRPERPCFVEQFEQMSPSYARRHEVRPGITGLAQVCAGYHTDARDKLRFDLIYVSHQSLWLDLLVMIRTVLVVLRGVK